ncbi:ABC transporter, ATP-binding protein [Corynebacterium efficiens YS-314]|uniref:Putative ABC transporter ATP-binding protein n=1 Tax=Corynebacterium efficiens (strain DSM 44549 / YS-314 / AJ 12310 / JCM 11189 / NBRC 100395) TaxID=196164 RepID=Q8FMC3_COREF|nr:ABC transporter ATP-binding protein [Corynebacterium efficiens]EEW51093.1 ABC transporter, ATP-binding protein [Corynebacterium efficiens YS-314]BAC19394.1 putative ABC transporter ATP-binding protein [Corynebacterium efficiens YS-314]
MIEVAGLTKQYGQVRAVEDLTFTVKPGMVTGFLGPNGAGKSTTMRCIVGLDNPTSGHATIDGQPYRALKNPLTRVGALLDAKATHPNRSAANHLKWIAQANGLPTSRVEEVLGLVGLSDVAGKKTGGFSLGMGQRLGLAAALLGDPEYLILDEPVNGLDPEGIHWVRMLLKNLAAEGRTVLVSSHLLSEMALTADHLVVIGRGRMVADTPIQDFIREHSATTVTVRTPQPDALQAALQARGIRFETTLVDARPTFTIMDRTTDEIGELAFAQGIALLELSEHRASLEQAFLQTTGESVEYQAATPPTPQEER